MDTEFKEAKNLVEKTQESAQEIGNRAKAIGGAAWQKAKNGYSNVQDKTVAGAKATDQTIRKYPYQTIGVAFGVGLLLGFLFRRAD